MKYSKATDYALHTMMFLAKKGSDSPTSVIELANVAITPAITWNR